MNLPYLLSGVVRHHLPAPLLFAMMRLRGGGNGAEQTPDQNAAELVERLAAEGVGLAGRHVLELGSGQYARLALRLLARGARRVTLVDLYAVALEEPAHRAMLLEDCARLGLDPADALGRISVHRGDFLGLALPAPADRPDLLLSTAVLEHVRDPGAILAGCYAWLRPGGATLHMVDLRDHSMQFRYPFEMLTFSDHAWERWLDHPGGFHLNRWRAPDYLVALERAGFTATRCKATLYDPDGLRPVHGRLAAQFRRYSAGQLAIQGIALVGAKPTGGDAG